jgi:hypothetical protein
MKNLLDFRTVSLVIWLIIFVVLIVQIFFYHRVLSLTEATILVMALLLSKY